MGSVPQFTRSTVHRRPTISITPHLAFQATSGTFLDGWGNGSALTRIRYQNPSSYESEEFTAIWNNHWQSRDCLHESGNIRSSKSANPSKEASADENGTSQHNRFGYWTVSEQ